MNRVLLAIGGAVVLALAIGAYVLSRDEGEVATGSTVVPKNAEAERARPHADVIRRSPAERASPVLPRGSAAAEVTTGKVHVRDHRSGDHEPIAAPPVITRPNHYKITTQLSSEVSQKVRNAVADCAASVPPAARGARPRVEGQVTIAIKNHEATITTAALELQDVTGIPLDPIKQCVEQKSIGVATPAGDEPDLDGYMITLSLRLP